MTDEINPENAVSAAFTETFIGILAHDIILSSRRLKADNNQAARRDFVRTVFVAIEGWLWEYRQQVHRTIGDTRDFSPTEAAAFAETTYTISDTGKLREQMRQFPLGPIFRFATRVVEEEYGKQIVDFSSKNWHNFNRAVAIRNRITHPKKISDLTLSDDDIAIVRASYEWLFETIAQVEEKATVVLTLHVDAFRKVLEGLKAGDPAMLELYNRALDFKD